MTDDFLKTPLEELLHVASRVRHEQFGNEIEFCAIINAKSDDPNRRRSSSRDFTLRYQRDNNR